MLGFFKKSFAEIPVNDVKQIKNAKIIDVRTVSEYHAGHIKRAKNIELSKLLSNHKAYLKKDEQYYLVCASGMRSKRACKKLGKQGYKVVNLIGGTVSYQK